MSKLRNSLLVPFLALSLIRSAQAQIDPVPRQLVQIGYNAALQGHAPISVYAFYYQNVPNWPATNLTLRTAIAPTYLDSELGIRGVITPHTDLGIGLAGGGFADSYYEIRRGKYIPEESFNGYGAEGSLSLYHLFNPDALIPLNSVVRGSVRYTTYDQDDNTDPNFQVPEEHLTYKVRTGLRWGGREPTLYPDLAMELSAWYEGLYRSESGTYGYNDRTLLDHSHLFWGEALLAYTFPESKQNIYLSITAGGSRNADRFSAYRLGALLPLVSEFPLSLPGYYYQEISAKEFVLFGGNYVVPLDKRQKWNLNVTAASAKVHYLDGLEQPGDWHSGVGAGFLYRTPSLKVMIGYGYGVNAIRGDHTGAHSIGILLQLDWAKAKAELFNPGEANRWRGLQRVFGVFGS